MWERNGHILLEEFLISLDETGFDQVNNMKMKVACFYLRDSEQYIQTSSDRTHMSAAVAVNGGGHL